MKTIKGSKSTGRQTSDLEFTKYIKIIQTESGMQTPNVWTPMMISRLVRCYLMRF